MASSWSQNNVWATRRFLDPPIIMKSLIMKRALFWIAEAGHHPYTACCEPNAVSANKTKKCSLQCFSFCEADSPNSTNGAVPVYTDLIRQVITTPSEKAFLSSVKRASTPCLFWCHNHTKSGDPLLCPRSGAIYSDTRASHESNISSSLGAWDL